MSISGGDKLGVPGKQFTSSSQPSECLPSNAATALLTLGKPSWKQMEGWIEG